MQKRYLSLWFKQLLTDQLTIANPSLNEAPLVIAIKDRGRQSVKTCNNFALKQGIKRGMSVADAKALVPDVVVEDNVEGTEQLLLKDLGEWCIRFSPIVAIDEPDGLLMDITGCCHLWQGEAPYLRELLTRLKKKGYQVRGAIADTIGAAWAVARYGKEKAIIANGEHYHAVLNLPPAALRLESNLVQRLHKLGMYRIENFIDIPRSVLRRRFGEVLLLRIAQAMGKTEEFLKPIYIPEPYTERLPCLEPVRTAKAIEIAVQKLLETLCARLQKEGMGLRKAVLTCYRIDGKVVSVSIGTHKSTHHIQHLYQLLKMRIVNIEPALGIELFVLEASGIEPVEVSQHAIWAKSHESDEQLVAEVLDRIAMRAGKNAIQRYLPQEHYWPERSIKKVNSLDEKPAIPWSNNKPRPTHLLASPQPVLVSAPIPDYPPILFVYKGKRHDIKKADGPERIEREWWIEGGEHRDYYLVEDEIGKRYWLFRSGHYAEERSEWFIHGFFA
jgi:protein ImuB